MIFQIKEIPETVGLGTTLEIMTTDISYFTHGFFKYPCKFIPQVPRWAILKYTKEGDFVLDPFSGSGTTLVEAVLNKRNALAVDFDKLSQLLCETKTSPLSAKQLNTLKQIRLELFNTDNKDKSFSPDLHNTDHWFSPENIRELRILRGNIIKLNSKINDRAINSFLLVCFASIIKKTSFTDDTSPKPYVSKRIKKVPASVRDAFLKAFDTNISNLEKYIDVKMGKSILISEDAREINAPEYKNQVTLAVTSPPYINAFDYVRVLRLENAWLGFYGDSNITDVKKNQIGTENIPVKEYGVGVNKMGIKILDNLLEKIAERDKKRAYVVYKYFMDMSKNFKEIKRLLKSNGHYVVVVGDSKIKDINVPTKDIFIEIAEINGFKLSNYFSYIIKNRYLRIPRSGRGGFIDKDWIIDLVK
ncbi:MAG TPA: DNA methyltransferase [Candidatus Paceibacterota bacterium]|nr:DNA methyltransferase [Candidatus Paceibacterota bacterium]